MGSQTCGSQSCVRGGRQGLLSVTGRTMELEMASGPSLSPYGCSLCQTLWF